MEENFEISEGNIVKRKILKEISKSGSPCNVHIFNTISRIELIIAFLKLSGLPKIHKDGVPLRGVVSTVGSPFEKLSRFAIPILRTIQGRSGLYLKNLREFKEKVKNWRVERNGYS